MHLLILKFTRYIIVVAEQVSFNTYYYYTLD